jgi:type I restriction enzyme S subunit
MNNIKPYTTYKPSGIAWLGDIPEHWEVMQTKNCFTFSKEKVGETYLGYDVLTLSISGVKVRDVKSGSGKFIPIETYQIVKPNSIILCLFDMDVTPRIVGHCNNLGLITSAYTNIVPNKNASSKYFYYYFLLQDFNNFLFSQGTGIRITLTNFQFGSIYLSLPPLPEQTAIAAFLDYKTAKIDRFIRKKKQLIKLLNEQKAAIINDAVTKGVNPNTKTKPSGIEWLGEIPVHWEVRKLKYVANCFPSNIDKHTKEGEKQVRLCNYTDVYKNDYITNDMSLMLATATDEQIEKLNIKHKKQNNE